MNSFKQISHFLFFGFIIMLFFILACNRQPTKVMEEHDPLVKKLEEKDSIRVIKTNKDSLQKVKQDKR